MTESEYKERYKNRLVEVAALTEDQAWACVNALTFQELSEWFEDDPEGAADEEMSNWTPD